MARRADPAGTVGPVRALPGGAGFFSGELFP